MEITDDMSVSEKNTHVMLLYPELANAIGLVPAIVLQQIRYWSFKCGKAIDGHKWIYNSITAWHKQFSFLSRAVLERTLTFLFKNGYILKGHYHRDPRNRTLWYAVDEGKFCAMVKNPPIFVDTIQANAFPQIEEMYITKNTRQKDIKKQLELSVEESIENEVLEQLCEIWTRALGNKILVPVWTDSRLKILHHLYYKIMKGDVNKWEHYLNMVSTSKFLMGEINGSFKAAPEYLLKESTFLRVEAGEFGVELKKVSQEYANKFEEKTKALHIQIGELRDKQKQIEQTADKNIQIAVCQIRDSWSALEEVLIFDQFMAATHKLLRYLPIRNAIKLYGKNALTNNTVEVYWQHFISEHYLGKTLLEWRNEAALQYHIDSYEELQHLLKQREEEMLITGCSNDHSKYLQLKSIINSPNTCPEERQLKSRLYDLVLNEKSREYLIKNIKIHKYDEINHCLYLKVDKNIKAASENSNFQQDFAVLFRVCAEQYQYCHEVKLI